LDGFKNLSKEEQKQISQNLDGILRELADAYVKFVNMGYIGLFPKDLGGMMLVFNTRVLEVNELIKEKGIVDQDTLKILGDILDRAAKIRDRMRQLLNVDALG
jgi:hypothetical protein